MKRCGIITIHKVPNYGATFQAFALQQFISSLNKVDVEIIDYRMNEKTACNKGRNRFRSKVCGILKNIPLYLSKKKKDKRFTDFWAKYYNLSPLSYNGDKEIFANPPYYDVYIAGSDQLFNLELTNNSKAFYLQFSEGKKIAYSTSFGMKGIQDTFLPIMKNAFPSFSSISVREKSASDYIKKEMGLACQTTVDPVLLLNKDEWGAYSHKVRLPGKYIFVYIMSDNDNINPTIQWVERETGLPVVAIKTFDNNPHVNAHFVEDAGPSEFLYIIGHAEFVITNSYHGSLLSIINRKSLCILEEKAFINDQRYKEVLNKAGMAGKIIPYKTDWKVFDFNDYVIDGTKAYERLYDWIKDSKNFIINNIR